MKNLGKQELGKQLFKSLKFVVTYKTNMLQGVNVTKNRKSKSCENSMRSRELLEVRKTLSEYLFCFMVNNNLAYYNSLKSLVDGDRLQVFWITQN